MSNRQADRPSADWDPRDPSVLADQRQAYDEMRERCPVAFSDFFGWSVFGYRDIIGVVENPSVYSNAARHPAIPNAMDPPEHVRYRAAVVPHFSDGAMASFEPRCRQVARSLVRGITGGGQVEFVSAFAEPFALRTLCLFLGWPEADWESLGGWTHGNQQAAFTRDPSAGRALAKLLGEHVQRNIERDRTADRDSVSPSLTRALLATQVDGRPLTDDQIASSLRNWIAGEGTVAAGLSLILLQLAENRMLQEELRAEPARIAHAVEELLRVDDPLVSNRRTATRDVEIAGRAIPGGSSISLMWIAGNRDPHQFQDASEVRLERDTADSLVWGHGIHVCLGAPLARLELRVAVEEILNNTQAIVTSGPAWRSVYPSNGMAELRLRLTAA